MSLTHYNVAAGICGKIYKEVKERIVKEFEWFDTIDILPLLEYADIRAKEEVNAAIENAREAVNNAGAAKAAADAAKAAADAAIVDNAKKAEDRAKKAAGISYQATDENPETNYGKFVVLDVETTGLDPASNRILEIALATVENGLILETWTTRFNPEGPVGKTEIHGITDSDVANAPLFSEKAEEVLKRITDIAVVAHNSRFDLAFLRAEFQRANLTLPWIAGICTLTISNYYQPHLPRRRLADCCEDIGIAISNAHSAVGDVQATARLFHYYMIPDKRPAPRKEELEVLRNPRVNGTEVDAVKLKNPISQIGEKFFISPLFNGFFIFNPIKFHINSLLHS